MGTGTVSSKPSQMVPQGTGLQYSVPVRRFGVYIHVGGGEIVCKTKLWLFVFLVWYLGWVENGVENGNWHPPGFKKSSEGRLV